MKSIRWSVVAFSVQAILALSAVTARAASHLVCISRQNAARELKIVVQNGGIVHVEGSRGTLVITRLPIQNRPGKIIYSVAGEGLLFEADTAILAGNEGEVRLGGESFSCAD